MIVWVASYPRSGNNLCSRQTLRSVFGATTGAVENPQMLTPRLELDPEADPVEAMREHDETIFLKTHRIADANAPDPAIYLVRDGRDSLVSHAHFIRSQRDRSSKSSRSFEETLAALIQRKDHPYGSWSANVRAWTHRKAPTQVIRFEELAEDSVEVVRKAVDALGVPLPEPSGEPPSFQELHEEDPELYRRGKSGVWKSEFPPDLQSLFWRLHGAEMEALGYSRE
jgi:Sulfotransferase domain